MYVFLPLLILMSVAYIFTNKLLAARGVKLKETSFYFNRLISLSNCLRFATFTISPINSKQNNWPDDYTKLCPEEAALIEHTPPSVSLNYYLSSCLLYSFHLSFFLLVSSSHENSVVIAISSPFSCVLPMIRSGSPT